MPKFPRREAEVIALAAGQKSGSGCCLVSGLLLFDLVDDLGERRVGRVDLLGFAIVCDRFLELARLGIGRAEILKHRPFGWIFYRRFISSSTCFRASRAASFDGSIDSTRAKDCAALSSLPCLACV